MPRSSSHTVPYRLFTKDTVYQLDNQLAPVRLLALAETFWITEMVHLATGHLPEETKPDHFQYGWWVSLIAVLKVTHDISESRQNVRAVFLS